MTWEAAERPSSYDETAAEACSQPMQRLDVATALQQHALAEQALPLLTSQVSVEAVLNAKLLLASLSEVRGMNLESADQRRPCLV